MEKFLWKLSTDLFFFSQQNLLHFYFHIKTVHFHFHIEIPFSNQRNKSSKKKFTFLFFLTVKSKMFRLYTHFYVWQKWNCCSFLTEKKISLYSIEFCPSKKFTEQEKNFIEKHRCVIAQHFTQLFVDIGEKNFRHTFTGTNQLIWCAFSSHFCFSYWDKFHCDNTQTIVIPPQISTKYRFDFNQRGKKTAPPCTWTQFHFHW